MSAFTKPEPKTERFEARLTKSQKKLFTEAASLEGFSNVSEYVIHTTLKNSQYVIQESKLIILSQRDSIKFYNSLQHPPQANAYLKNAMREFLSERKA